jgi:hypothetical protein
MLSRSQKIHSSPVMIVALKSVAVNQSNLRVFVYCNSSTSFSAHSAFVFCIHDPLTEIALINVEVRRVEREKSRKKYVFYLFRLRMLLSRLMRKEIAKHEAPFLRSMSVEVYVDVEVFRNICIMKYCFLNGPDCWLIELTNNYSKRITLLGFR